MASIASGPRILAFDLETAPSLVYTFSLFKPIIGHEQIVEPARIICFSAQWVGEKKTIFMSEHHDGYETMLKGLYDLLEEADIVLTFNGATFDGPWSTGEFMAQGWTPPSPFKHIDLYQHVKRLTRFPSKKLDYVSYRILGEKKVKHEGFTLWRDCLAGDDKAWNRMKRYAIQDTKLLVKLFNEIRGWIKVPHPVAHDGVSCHNCGGKNLQRRGYATTLTGVYQRFQCQNPKCGKWMRGTARSTVSEFRNIA